MNLTRAFSEFATATAKFVGRPFVFVACLILVIVWAASGPLFHFSDTWQLIINTGTTVLTFLVVFLIQNTQNRDNAAVQAKLDELILTGRAENRFIGIEHLTDRELEKILAEVESYAQLLQRERRGRRGRKDQADAAAK
jgi:low affinity Fe/Cu permease